MKTTVRQQLEREGKKIEARLAPLVGGMEPRKPGSPGFDGPRAKYELSKRARAVTCGGLAAMHDLVRGLGLPAAIDARLGILKQARPYQDSDHILNIAYNVMCGGQVLDDLELRRNDATYLDMLGTQAIPDPTTAGDFCRRFDAEAVGRLMGIFNEMRLLFWRRSGRDLGKETYVLALARPDGAIAS